MRTGVHHSKGGVLLLSWLRWGLELAQETQQRLRDAERKGSAWSLNYVQFVKLGVEGYHLPIQSRWGA